ncbi:uncharacterized protein LOC132724562 [Ruditapes philippinarum]|uniref:uncharacterized protein LOC132724562 n=1 Tax=Ruditapes philippinarum TaxID=129788 RepID=UPI00295AF499|nr:uncharacterized protein LOC132724562 [Ruditapes philippinarum]
MPISRKELISVQLNVYKPAREKYIDYFLAVVGPGGQLGNEDPNIAPRCHPVGHHSWTKKLWLPKESNVYFKFLLVKKSTNAIIELEEIFPHRLYVGHKALNVEMVYNRTNLVVSEVCDGILMESRARNKEPVHIRSLIIKRSNKVRDTYFTSLVDAKHVAQTVDMAKSQNNETYNGLVQLHDHNQNCTQPLLIDLKKLSATILPCKVIEKKKVHTVLNLQVKNTKINLPMLLELKDSSLEIVFNSMFVMNTLVQPSPYKALDISHMNDKERPQTSLQISGLNKDKVLSRIMCDSTYMDNKLINEFICHVGKESFQQIQVDNKKKVQLVKPFSGTNCDTKQISHKEMNGGTTITAYKTSQEVPALPNMSTDKCFITTTTETGQPDTFNKVTDTLQVDKAHKKVLDTQGGDVIADSGIEAAGAFNDRDKKSGLSPLKSNYYKGLIFMATGAAVLAYIGYCMFSVF